MRLRSLLFTPGDSTEKMAKAAKAGADAIILDLEDSVALERKVGARATVAGFLKAEPRSCGFWVRINPLTSGMALADLAAVVPAAPDGIVLPKCESARDLEALDHYIAALETAAGLELGRIRVLPIATETPGALFGLGTYRSAPRLAGLTWGAEDLPAALGASANREADGSYTPICALARSLCVAGSGAAGVPPIETVYPAFRDTDGLARYAALGRRDGFRGMLAIHPAQVPVINDAFSPSEAELAEARRVVELFEANRGKGTLALDGRMVDFPHLKQAQQLIAWAEGG